MTNDIDVSSRKCRAMRLLSHEWSAGELAMTMQVGPAAVRRHIRGNCRHRSDHKRPEWDGRPGVETRVSGEVQADD